MLDGDASHVPVIWVLAVIDKLKVVCGKDARENVVEKCLFSLFWVFRVQESQLSSIPCLVFVSVSVLVGVHSTSSSERFS